MKNILLFFFVIVFIKHSFSQTQDKNELLRSLSIEEINEDLEILKMNLETVHSGLYTYTSKTEMNEVFNEIKKSTDKSISAIDFYRKAVTLHKYIKNGHTRIMPPLYYEKELIESFTLLPFDVYFDNDTLYVLKNYSSNNAIKEGSIIKSINNEDASNLFKELVSNASRDGDNDTFPMMVTTLEFNKSYCNLKGVYPSYHLELITPGNERLVVEIKGLTTKEIGENKWNRYKDDGKWWGETDKPVLELNIENGIAIMKVQTFSIYYARRVNQKFKKFFNESFKKIKELGINNLILDLRYNGGGDEMPTLELLSHLLDEPYTFYEDMYTITNKLPNIEFYDVSRLDNFLYSLFKLRKKGNTYAIKGIPGLKKVHPSKWVYNGNVYVITNGLSFSATGEFCSFLKDKHRAIFNRAIFIGEEVGGNSNQHVSGTSRMLTLPNSKIRIQIPMELFKLNVNHKDKNHGVVPDYYIRPSIMDKLSNKDPELDFTLNLIQKTK